MEAAELRAHKLSRLRVQGSIWFDLFRVAFDSSCAPQPSDAKTCIKAEFLGSVLSRLTLYNPIDD